MEDEQGNAALRVCATVGSNEWGPGVTLSITKDYQPGESSALVLFKTFIQGEDAPRTLSIGTSVSGHSVVVGVDLSGEPGNTNVCVDFSDAGIPQQCVYVRDLVELPPLL